MSVDMSNFLVLRIVDKGIGFAQDRVVHLLRPFTKEQQHSAGTGLGLYIAKMLAERMGGTLELNSRPGEGTSFTVTIPIHFAQRSRRTSSVAINQEKSRILISDITQETTEEFQRSTLSSSSEDASEDDPQVVRVLVVDDNHLCRTLLVRAISRREKQIATVEAANGEEAVEAFAKYNPDLVITDVSMPIMDGVTASRCMRKHAESQRWKKCGIYALTGLGSSDPRLQSLGMDGTAALDGWLIKGKDNMDRLHALIQELRIARGK